MTVAFRFGATLWPTFLTSLPPALYVCKTSSKQSIDALFATASPVGASPNALEGRDNGLVERNDFIPHGKDALIDFYVEYGTGAEDYINLVSKLSWNSAGYFDKAGTEGTLETVFNGNGEKDGKTFSQFTFADAAYDFIMAVEFFHNEEGVIGSCHLVLGTAHVQLSTSVPLSEKTHHRCFVNGNQVNA
ncbi:uncharacterized protein L969DRAFT_623268 [Mixia osmundae IAM 14324]|uniref:Uncharacterized protein n=1 Tax=Mixia osmundae (strain CBS 9802 / IAM 14324 / JCM 22182 / KY 12970) TaxID=764103 RepID=G7E422_MIXOS|nr:uncharacterized protein L969DRAFT_623268 [Mixia osmundae IAM 14324]KEI39675.1 hypothetical protein L969DRAFT_623268 [Mixia osmundae IAM 14324]GAA97582.1 hypothetical protein E5Q_04260 [Mixia osmundae IAM 14324]